ncbi:MAG: fasciclin domain-containing protein [Methanosarcinaceae archaeon]|nr:fasciclin domain-containing protein [Methanosarcinaceae archaeon]
MTELKDLIQTATDMGSFSTLLKAAKLLGFTEKFRAGETYTIFAPLENVFDEIPDSVIDESFDDEEYLLDIINYHIVPGKYMVEELERIDSLKAFNGRVITITSDDGIHINNIKIVKPDIECSNGVIHAIDSILLP